MKVVTGAKVVEVRSVNNKTIYRLEVVLEPFDLALGDEVGVMIVLPTKKKLEDDNSLDIVNS